MDGDVARRRRREAFEDETRTVPAADAPGVEIADFRGERSHEVMVETRVVVLDDGFRAGERRGEGQGNDRHPAQNGDEAQGIAPCMRAWKRHRYSGKGTRGAGPHCGRRVV
jgi:hypothetical protein